ncbi:hypothetical protein DL240_08700 [Lujinxingia litoralis]|uniref:Uncharacterized protein n=1 Tax=Lujinxingia litoralis TaxID=2211119 RepID=A0A328C8G7_9DELT|nr:hypothetical protein [Lujinxingia litoralis]RAL22960.1 hypothetical protein DL240_08700 [Lujinxingia litoralis]
MRRHLAIIAGSLFVASLLAGCEKRPEPAVDRDALTQQAQVEHQALTEAREALDTRVTGALDDAADQVREAIEEADDIDEATFEFED